MVRSLLVAAASQVSDRAARVVGKAVCLLPLAGLTGLGGVAAVSASASPLGSETDFEMRPDDRIVRTETGISQGWLTELDVGRIKTIVGLSACRSPDFAEAVSIKIVSFGRDTIICDAVCRPPKLGGRA